MVVFVFDSKILDFFLKNIFLILWEMKSVVVERGIIFLKKFFYIEKLYKLLNKIMEFM